MRANGVARTVIIQVIHYKWDNSFLLSVLKRYPTLFHGVCRVNPEDPAAPDELTRLTEEGFRGVRISPAADASGDWIRGPLMPPLWRRCSELKVPMTVLVPATRLPDLVPLIEANPELTVVIDHMADCPLDRPDLLQHLLDLARYPRVFVKISDMWSLSKQPYPYADAQDQVKRLLERFSARAPDVGDELARLTRATPLRKDRRALSRPHELSLARGARSDSKRNRATRLAFRAVAPGKASVLHPCGNFSAKAGEDKAMQRET